MLAPEGRSDFRFGGRTQLCSGAGWSIRSRAPDGHAPVIGFCAANHDTRTREGQGEGVSR
eukprot:4226882-Prymnesium_polylepis.1